MFSVTNIWKRGVKQLGLAAALALGLTLVSAGGAEAAGETYTWTDSTKTTITATGGNFEHTQADFAKQADRNGNHVYLATATYTCGNQTHTSQLLITMTPASQQANPSSGTLSGTHESCSQNALRNFSPPVVRLADTNAVTGQSTAKPDAADRECDQGHFTWLFCPVIDNVSKAISGLAKDALVPLLKVNQITPESTPELYQAWTAVRDLANVMFILIFFAIIAGTLMNQDIGWLNAYNIRTIWSRLLIAAVLVQFSFLFSGFLVDIGNILGGGIEAALTSALPPQSTPATLGNLVENLVTGAVGVFLAGGAIAVLASWTAAVPLLLSLLLSLLVVFLTLGARYLLLAILIVLSPLAFAAMVLPNTRGYFEAWLKFFFRLVLMYPIVVAVLVIAGILNRILPFSGDTTASGAAAVAAAIVKPLIVIAAFMVIPAAFKFAGGALTRLQDFFSRSANRGQGFLRGTELWSQGAQARAERQNMMQERVLRSKAVTSLGKKGTLGRGAAGFIGGASSVAFLGAPTNTASLQKRNSALIRATKKELEELDEAWNPKNVHNAVMSQEGRTAEDRAKAKAAAQADAPNLLRHANTALGRRAMKQLLADRKFLTDELTHAALATDRKASWWDASASQSYDYTNDLSVLQSERSVTPAMVMRLMQDKKNYEVRDGAGNLIRTEERFLGDVDTTNVAKRYSRLDAKTAMDKNRYEDYDLMAKAADANATERERRAAKQAFEAAFGLGMQEKTVDKVFDVANKWTESNPEARLKMLLALRANSDQYPQYKSMFDTALRYLHQDEKIVGQLIQKAARPEQYEALSQSARAVVVRDYIRGLDYAADRYPHGYEAEARTAFQNASRPTSSGRRKS